MLRFNIGANQACFIWLLVKERVVVESVFFGSNKLQDLVDVVAASQLEAKNCGFHRKSHFNKQSNCFFVVIWCEWLIGRVLGVLRVWF